MTTANPNRRVFWAGLLLILAFTFTANAQEFRGLIAGKITDPNGAVVPGSKVEVKNTETGIVSTAVTGEDGTYNFPLLPPGKYQLTVTKENFNTAVRDGIEVRVADQVDARCAIGNWRDRNGHHHRFRTDTRHGNGPNGKCRHR